MPLLEVEANKLTNPTLAQGVVELYGDDRGGLELFKQLPLKPVTGSTYDWVVEKALPTGNSARSPYGGTPIPSGVGARTRLDVKLGHLQRNADTAKIDIRVKSDINDLHTEDIKMAAKKFMIDYRMNFVHGLGGYQKGTGWNLNGLDYYLDKFAGRYESGALTASDFPNFSDRKMFGTDDEDPYGTKEFLDLDIMEDLTTRYKGAGFDVIYSDRITRNKFKGVLNASPGNTAEMIMDETFGKSVFTYNGIPWIVLDTIGAEKTSSEDVAASVSVSATGEITVNSVVDPYFIGLTDLDIGRTFKIYNAPRSTGGTVVAEGTISDITGDYTAESDVTTAAGPGYLYIDPTNAMYGVRYGEMDGVTALYGAGPSGMSVDFGMYNESIAGFEAEELGMLDDAPLYRTRLDWIGNYVVHDPNAIIRLSHYKL